MMAAIEIMLGMRREKNWVKSWSRGKKKARGPLKNKASRALCNYSNSMVATGFPLKKEGQGSERSPVLLIVFVFQNR